MRRSHFGRWRSGLVAASAFLVLVGTGAMPAAAARPAAVAFTVGGDLGDDDIGGEGPRGANVNVVQRRAGLVIRRSSGKVDRYRLWRVKVEWLRAGDRLTVTIGSHKRVVTVPAATVEVVAGAETITGQVPSSAVHIWLDALDSLGGLDLDEENHDPVAQPDGTFAVPIGFKLGGGDMVDLSWEDPTGDIWRLIKAVPMLGVRAGSPRVVGFGVRPASVKVTLRSAGGVRLAAARVGMLAFDGSFGTTLRKNGVPVKPKVGDVISSSAIPGATFTLRANDLMIDPAGNGTVTATCVPGGAAIIAMPDPDDPGYYGYQVVAPVAPDGTVRLEDLTGGNGSPYPNSAWDLLCESPEGFVQAFRYRIPRN